MWVPILNTLSKTGRLPEVITEAEFKHLIQLFFLWDNRSKNHGIAYAMYNIRQSDPTLLDTIHRVLVEIVKVFSLLIKHFDLNMLSETERGYFFRYFWTQLKANVQDEVKHWCFYLLSDISGRIQAPEENNF